MDEITTSPDTMLGHAYRGPEGVYDEMVDADGAVRPHWRYMANALGTLGLPALHDRWRDARRLLRESGATYNVYGDPQGLERPWLLDPIPVVISSDEWREIEDGLVQRAELLNLILRDLYGPQELLKQGLLPPELVFGHGGFLRPCHPMPSQPHPLVLYSADLVRGPDGRVHVLADRTQAPSGAGYALENRVVMSRVMPSLYRDSHVHRLSLFFQNVRASLAALAPRRRADPRVVLLTPGPLNEAYFEHTYLASYLGYTLARGGDLVVQDGRVFLRSVGRLAPVDVILRRVDDHYCDPLELFPGSRLGVPGLTEAVRRGSVAIANPLGASILENPALNVFLPAIAKHLLGHDLLLPSITTWWCGDPSERSRVLSQLDRYVIRPIYREPGGTPFFGELMPAAGRRALAERIRGRPEAFVAQERVRFSSVPAVVASGIESRQAVIRTFLVARDDGYVVMPGALTRIAASSGSVIISNQAGGVSKDTWILATEPEKQVSLLPAVVRDPAVVAGRAALPGGAADNLFWLGRYAERAEQAIRLVRTAMRLVRTEMDPGDPDRAWHADVLEAVTHVTGTYPGFVGELGAAQRAHPLDELRAVVLDATRVGSVAFDLQATLGAAYAVRDRLSGDTWRIVNDVRVRLERFHDPSRSPRADLEDELDALVTDLIAIFGLAQESMVRSQGWIFLDAGRRVERALLLIALVRATLVGRIEPQIEGQLLEAVLAVSESLTLYRSAFHERPRLDRVLGLLLLDETNPRSLGYQIARLQTSIAEIAHDDARVELADEERLILDAASTLRLSDLVTLCGELDADGRRLALQDLLAHVASRLTRVSDVVTRHYFADLHGPRHLASATTVIS